MSLLAGVHEDAAWSSVRVRCASIWRAYAMCQKRSPSCSGSAKRTAMTASRPRHSSARTIGDVVAWLSEGEGAVIGAAGGRDERQELKWSQGDSNPCYRRERPAS